MLILIRQKEKTKKHAEIQQMLYTETAWQTYGFILAIVWVFECWILLFCLCIFCALFVTVCRFGLSMLCKCSPLPFVHEVSLNLWMAAVFCFFWVWPKPSWNLPNRIQTQTVGHTFEKSKPGTYIQFYRGKPSMSMHGTKESCHSNHGPQSVLKLNVRNVFSCKPRGQTKQNKHTIYTRETCWSETHLV